MELAAPNHAGANSRRDRRACRTESPMAGVIRWGMSEPAPKPARPLSLLSVIIPARNEAGCILSTVQHLHLELQLQAVPHEIIVVNDGSTDQTWDLLKKLQDKMPELVPVQNSALHGFGRAVVC